MTDQERAEWINAVEAEYAKLGRPVRGEIDIPRWCAQAEDLGGDLSPQACAQAILEQVLAEDIEE